MLPDNIPQREHISIKKKWTQNRALRYSTNNWGRWWGKLAYSSTEKNSLWDKSLTIVRLAPDTDQMLNPPNKNIMIHGINGSWKNK